MAPHSKDTNIMMVLKSIYNNEFQWNFIKSIGFFALGARIAYQCAGMEIMPAIPH